MNKIGFPGKYEFWQKLVMFNLSEDTLIIWLYIMIIF